MIIYINIFVQKLSTIREVFASVYPGEQKALHQEPS
jgi:hypothetical protein